MPPSSPRDLRRHGNPAALKSPLSRPNRAILPSGRAAKHRSGRARHGLCSTTSSAGVKAMTNLCGPSTVEFRFFRPEASAVHVAGDFNRWKPDALPMQRAGDGWWHARVALDGGEYRFRYLADGNWFTD